MASFRPFPPPQQPSQSNFPPLPPQPPMNPFGQPPPPPPASYGRMPAPHPPPPYHAPPPPPPGPPPPHQPQFGFPSMPPPPPQQLFYPPPPPYGGGNSNNSNNPPPSMPLPPPPPPPPPSSPPPSAPPPPPPGPPPKETPPLAVAHTKQAKAGALPRAETEEERRARKRREYEKQRQEERRQQMLRQSQATVLHKTQQMAAAARAAQQGQPPPPPPPPPPHGSSRHHHQPPGGSRIAPAPAASGSRAGALPSAERFENRLKKPTTFLCRHKFRNELPDPTAQLKLLPLNKDKDRYTKYRITSLEKSYKPKLYIPDDLGIPLDLLDMSVYNPPAVQPSLAPEDEELLRDDEVVTPVKPEGIRKKDRPTDKGVSWLVKTQYISPLSTDAAKLSITEKQAKEMRESRQGRNTFLENLNNREKQIQAIEESFKAAKLPPVHQTKRGMEAEWVLPLLPDFDRYDDRFVMVNFDGAPTADSEQYNKLERSVRDECESQAVMKSFVVNGSDPAKPEKFLAYMVPSPNELTKDDLDDENEEMHYSWLREYHWDVRGDDVDDPTTYLVSFDDKAAKYLPLPTKLVLQKKKAKEGRSGDDIEHFPVPSRITVRRTSDGGAMERGESSRNHENSKRERSYADDDLERDHKLSRTEDMMDQSSGEEDYSV